jgi:hypothetical protein
MTDEQTTLPGMPEAVDPIRHAGRTIIIKETGQRALLIGGTGSPGSVAASTEFSRHIMRHYKLSEIELAPGREFSRKGYDLTEDLTPIMTGLVNVPNFEPYDRDPLDFLNILTLGGLWTPSNAGYAKVYHQGQTRQGWAKYFLTTGQGGGFTGEGYVIIYDTPKYVQAVRGEDGEIVTPAHSVGGALIGHFAICKHQKQEGAGANHQRGWHPGHCKVCGMDMTVDSGD